MMFFGTVPLKTERLELRRYRRSDEEEVFHVIGEDPKVNQYISWRPCVTREGTRKFIQLHLEQYRSDQSFFGWAIEKDGRFIGSIGTFHMDIENESCEIGYNIGSKYWNQGIATEALTKVLSFLLQSVGLHKVYASCHEENLASRRVMEKAGMKYEGMAKEAIKDQDGSYKDAIFYYVLQSGWKAHESCEEKI